MEFHPHSINHILSKAYVESGLNLNSDDMAKLIGLQTEFIFEAYSHTPVPTDKGRDVKDISKLFCQRVSSWCSKNNVEYFGDYLIAPVFENILREISYRNPSVGQVR
jgi:hypothetical protein